MIYLITKISNLVPIKKTKGFDSFVLTTLNAFRAHSSAFINEA